MKVTFTLEKETKNTYRFQEQVAPGGTAVIGTLYIQKSALGDSAPQTITVEVTPA